MNRGGLLTPSVFYHPGPLNTMADDASYRFYLPDNKFISFLLLFKILPVSFSRFMDTVPSAFWNQFVCDIRSEQKDVLAGYVADTRTSFLYNQFRSLCATM